ncbi:MAG: lysophospholipid acyltransferase family protein [Candidatus Omnitrophica bacterium]|nr:lysophospholipid acyltransferase family protein [Candidatus Omnitrophota bacterium]
MEIKKIQKSIGRFFGWLVLVICSFIIKLIPEGCLYGFAKGIAFLGYQFTHKQRRIAQETLDIAFGNQKSKAEKEKIAKESFVYMAKSAVEVISLMDSPELMKRRISLVNKGNLDNALARGNGVILVSGHFGNFPLLLARLSQEGYEVSGIMRPMRDQRVENIFLKKRQRYGVRTIYSKPRDTCVSSSIEALRNNQLVFIPIDQNFGTAGVFVNFFGKKAATATGPIIFAQRTGASLVPCFILRQKDDTHRIVFEPPLTLESRQSPRETIAVNIQKLTDIIEAYIRRYPAEWGWVHRRWKSKPSV